MTDHDKFHPYNEYCMCDQCSEAAMHMLGDILNPPPRRSFITAFTEAMASVPPIDVEIVETEAGTEHRFKDGGTLFIPRGINFPTIPEDQP